MKILATATAFLTLAAVTAPVAAMPPYRASQPPLATFDLADFTVPQLHTTGLRRNGERHFLAPEIGAPPGPARKPARLRIRGRKIKLRVPLG